MIRDGVYMNLINSPEHFHCSSHLRLFLSIEVSKFLGSLSPDLDSILTSAPRVSSFGSCGALRGIQLFSNSGRKTSCLVTAGQ